MAIDKIAGWLLFVGLGVGFWVWIFWEILK
jgi:hypothetical protein